MQHHGRQYFTHTITDTHGISECESAKHICACPSLLPYSLGSSAISVYRQCLSQWHSQFTPSGECLRVIQQPPWRVLALTTGTHHPPRCLGHFSRGSETSTASVELTQAFFHYVVLLADSFGLEQPSGARHALCCESMITTIGFATQTMSWRLSFPTFCPRTYTDSGSSDLSLSSAWEFVCCCFAWSGFTELSTLLRVDKCVFKKAPEK